MININWWNSQGANKSIVFKSKEQHKLFILGKYAYAYAYMHVTTINKQRSHEFEKEEQGYIGGFGER